MFKDKYSVKLFYNYVKYGTIFYTFTNIIWWVYTKHYTFISSIVFMFHKINLIYSFTTAGASPVIPLS